MSEGALTVIVVLGVLAIGLPGLLYVVHRKRLAEYREYLKHRDAVAKQAKGGE